MSARDGLTVKADASGDGSQDGNADVNQGGTENNNSSGTDDNNGTAAGSGNTGSNGSSNAGSSGSGTGSGASVNKAAKTGDTVPIIALILTALVSGTAIIAAAKRRTR